jgi:hypothetical protein
MRDDIFVADVACNQFRPVRKVFRPFAVAVDLLDQAVEHAHLASAPKKLIRDRASNEAGTARYQNSFWQFSRLLCFVSSTSLSKTNSLR